MEIFDEYARRQYEAKAPSRNPFGVEMEPKKFLEFDVFTKVRVLHQLSVWTLGNADRIRQQMVEQTEKEQTAWVSMISAPLQASTEDVRLTPSLTAHRGTWMGQG